MTNRVERLMMAWKRFLYRMALAAIHVPGPLHQRQTIAVIAGGERPPER